ncbi:hypothetical protein PG991_008770 [Apiospora marii]|uniref:Uncharacterized protein n=1 Tax=Apiospora marii TaxID=335849 RepID=A0ABR1RLZ8_9PEZI
MVPWASVVKETPAYTVASVKSPEISTMARLAMGGMATGAFLDQIGVVGQPPGCKFHSLKGWKPAELESRGRTGARAAFIAGPILRWNEAPAGSDMMADLGSRIGSAQLNVDRIGSMPPTKSLDYEHAESEWLEPGTCKRKPSEHSRGRRELTTLKMVKASSQPKPCRLQVNRTYRRKATTTSMMNTMLSGSYTEYPASMANFEAILNVGERSDSGKHDGGMVLAILADRLR